MKRRYRNLWGMPRVVIGRRTRPRSVKRKPRGILEELRQAGIQRQIDAYRAQKALEPTRQEVKDILGVTR
jgi:hypothetical protein